MFMYIISNLQLCCYEPHQNQHDTRTFFSDNVSYVCFTNFEQIFRGVSRTLPNNYDVTFPASAYLLKVNNRNTRTRYCLFAGWVCAKMFSGWRLLTVFAKKPLMFDRVLNTTLSDFRFGLIQWIFLLSGTVFYNF